MTRYDPDMASAIAKTGQQIVMEIAKSICSVQPMPSRVMHSLCEFAQDEAALIAAGYRPIDPVTRFMWVKE